MSIEEKQIKLTNLVSSFCKEKLFDEHLEFAINIIEKMSRKHNVPFNRGKLEIWASGIIYALAQYYSLFDKSLPFHLNADEICDYYNTNKSTVAKKATTISTMFNLKQNNKYKTKKSNKKTRRKENFFDKINKLIDDEEYEIALEKLNEIKENDPDYSIAIFYKSVIYSYIDDKKEKEKDIDLDGEESIEDEKIYDEFFINGLDEFNKGNFTKALDLFDLAISFTPDEKEVYYYKALTHGFLNDYEEAIKEIDRAIMIDYDDYRFWNDKGNFLTKTEDFIKAEKCYNQAIKLKPNDPLIFANKGFMYLQFKKYEEALNTFDKAYEIDSKIIHVIVGMANVYLEIGDFENAEKSLDEAKNIDSNDLEYLKTLSHYLMVKQNFKEAISCWDKCLKIDDKLAEAWVNKAIIYSYLENEEEYKKCINKAIEIEPMIIFSLDED